MQTTTTIWTFRDSTLQTDLNKAQVVGYEVEALDGSIGKIDEATFDAGSAFRKKVMLPVGVINRADHTDEKVFVNRTKEQIKNAPEFDDSLKRDEAYREQLGSYYGSGGAGHRD